MKKFVRRGAVGMAAATTFFLTTILGGAALTACSHSSDSSDDGNSVVAPEDGNNTSSSTDDSGNNNNNSGNSGSGSNQVTPGGTAATAVMDTPTAADVSNATVNIVKSEGWLNSAYIVFEQVEGATYKVFCDDVEIDAPLIRYYDTYTYYEQSEDEDLQVTWTKKTLSKVVRADALGLAAGEHTIKVCAVGTENTSEYSSAKMKVVDHNRSGFAFAPEATTTPGAYKADGTLKDGAIVVYLTQGNKKTVTATIGGKPYTGIQDITQAIKTKNTSNPVDIRIIGTVTAESNDLSCADMSSAYALGVKGASQVTIEGVGHDATLYGAGVAAFQSEYIEVSNLGLMKWGGGKDGDGISLKAGKFAWIHNCDYFYGNAGSDGDQVKGDGSMDLKDDQQYTTIAYNHFWDSGKMSLCGMKSETGPNYITYHHNWFDHSDSRHPRIRTMTVHVYNNYFDGNSKYGVGVTTGASCFVEQNFFRNAHNPMMSSKQGTDAQGEGTFSGEKGGVIKAYNNKFVQNNTNGVKFQYITNKYDYTNNKELGEYKEWYETVGTDNGDGTWTIYDSKVTDTDDGIADNSLIAIEDASKKGAYYQGSNGKTMFYIDVPANATKVIVKAKTGSSTSGATTTLSVNGTKSESIGNTAYSDFEFALSGLTEDSTIEIANSGSNSLNISEIKVIAASGWQTKLTSGADLTNIDAYEVDDRDEQVPANVTAKSGGTMYSNFDVALGDSGMGVTIAPTEPEQAKANVLKYSGRHESDYYFNFTNSVDDASYAKNDKLNNELVAYTSGMTAIQGYVAGSTSGDSGSTTDGTEGTGDSGSTTVELPTGSAVVALVVNGAVEPSDARVTCSSCSVNTKDSNGALTIEYNGTTYTTVKMESASTITVKATAGATVTVVGSLPIGKQSCFKLNGTAQKLDAKTTEVTTFTKTFTSTGNDVITKGDTAAIGIIAISE